MEHMKLLASMREASNKGAARTIRRSNRIPAVVYGNGPSQAISIDAKEWSTRFGSISGNTIINLAIGDDEHSVLVKDTQEDIISGRTNHVDFYEIQAGRMLHTSIPVHLEGSAHGVLEGGILEQKIDSLEVSCLPKDIPTHFSIDISPLGVGESLHVGELTIPEGVEMRTESNLTIVVVSHAKAAEEEEVEEEEGMEGEIEPDGDGVED